MLQTHQRLQLPSSGPSSSFRLIDFFSDSLNPVFPHPPPQVYTAFLTELSLVKKQFDQLRRKPPVDKTLPRYAGAAMWALGLQRRIGRPMAHLSEIAPLLPHAPELAELQLQHGQVVAAIEQVGFRGFWRLLEILCFVGSAERQRHRSFGGADTRKIVDLQKLLG
jgi:hypothetical protein